VQKSPQIQQNLQEYQDIIVRFTDEQVGTVRCLTTLTELIQVISQPSFLFASVASNPNLRSLLDMIAESSKTDQHGDQVITNLSILQPGQQWQKAKIRLVTKIFLEPAELTQDQNESEVTHQGLTLDLAESNPESMTDASLDIQLNNASGEDEQDNSEDVIIKLGSESNSQTLTINSLFDDFPEPPLPSSQSTQIVNDITENSDFSDSLFDDFMNVDSGNSYRETENLSIQQVSEQTKPTDADDDLFGNFSSNDDSVKAGLNKLEGDIESIKSRIPKQNLDEFLHLMDEEEQIKVKSETINNKKDIDKDALHIKTDFGATNIERILSNMETITLRGSSSKSSSDFVTLEDFAEDLNSVSF
jgi:Arc/MetJ-type ribon-helix-helix transcriptional regulator